NVLKAFTSVLLVCHFAADLTSSLRGRARRQPRFDHLRGVKSTLTIFLRYVFLALSRPGAEGVSDQRLQTRGGERWPGVMTSHRRCGAKARRPKPHLSLRASPACRGPVMAGSGGARVTGAPPQSALASLRWDVMQQVLSSHGRNDHRGGCGASRLNTARGTPGFGGLAACLADRPNQGGTARRKGLRQASMSRGVEARGSVLDPWRPAPPRFSLRATRIWKMQADPGAWAKIRVRSVG